MALALALVAHSGDVAPDFGDCRVAPDQAFEPRASPPRLRLDTRHAKLLMRPSCARPSRARLIFAGHYKLAMWGCGAGCVMAAAINTRSGRVVFVPFTVSDWPLDAQEPLSYRQDSCLLKVQGRRNEAQQGGYFYRFDGGGFRSWNTLEADRNECGGRGSLLQMSGLRREVGDVSQRKTCSAIIRPALAGHGVNPRSGC